MAKKGQWLTPINALRNKEETWTKLEDKGWPPIKLESDKPITYFNNPKRLELSESEEYDRFFDYTKIFPLWDQRKAKDNMRFHPDIQENIFYQEKDKPVPVLTSMTYGLAARPFYDHAESGYRRLNAIGDFRRRRGVMRVIEKKPAQ